MKNLIRVMVVAMLLAAVGAGPAQAQGQQYQNLISANPFGLLIEFYNAEYERVVGGSSTVGVGGSYATFGDEDYVNTDLFYRFYPGGEPLDGWAFGIKAGLTSVPDQGTYFGYGFDTNWSWLLGERDNFYVGVGFGLKRLVGVEDDTPDDADVFDLQYVPTFRVVNIGFAF